MNLVTASAKRKKVINMRQRNRYPADRRITTCENTNSKPRVTTHNIRECLTENFILQDKIEYIART